MNIKNIFSFIVALSFFCCAKQNEQNEQIEIYYYDTTIHSIIVPIKCSEMDKVDGLKKIKLNNEDLLSKLKKIKNSKLDQDFRSIDVRYKIVFNEDTLCLDYNSNFIYRDTYGKVDFLNDLEKLIEENDSKSIYINNPTAKPYLDNFE